MMSCRSLLLPERLDYGAAVVFWMPNPGVLVPDGYYVEMEWRRRD